MRAVWWWIDRWRKSTAYTDMTLAEQGAFRNISDEVILRGGAIPPGQDALARASGCPAEWPALQDAILPRLRLTERGWELLDRGLCTPARSVRDEKNLHRRHIPLWIRRAVFSRDGRCRACGSVERLELDHVLPYSRGGQDTEENLQVLCKPCNVAKGAGL